MADTIDRILQGLSPKDRGVLRQAFESGLSRSVEYMPGRFVGVNIPPLGGPLAVELESGRYCEGAIVSRPGRPR